MFLSVRALVLFNQPYKEYDRILGLLTKEHGVIRCVAVGAAKHGHQFFYGTQPGFLTDFVLRRSKNYWYVKEIEIIESFRKIQEDPCYLTAAAHILEIAGDVCVDIETSSQVILLLLHTFYAMHDKNKEYKLVVCAFEWRILSILGLSADLQAYTEENRSLYTCGLFSFSSCKLIYTNRIHAVENTILLSNGAIEALSYIQNISIDRLFSFTLQADVLDELEKVTHRYLCERLEKKYDKMNLLSFYS